MSKFDKLCVQKTKTSFNHKNGITVNLYKKYIKETKKLGLSFKLTMKYGIIIRKIVEFCSLNNSYGDIKISNNKFQIKSYNPEKQIYISSTISNDTLATFKFNTKNENYSDDFIEFGINMARFLRDIKTITKFTYLELFMGVSDDMVDDMQEKLKFNYLYTKPKSNNSPEGYIVINNKHILQDVPHYEYSYSVEITPSVLLDYCKSAKNTVKDVKFVGRQKSLKISFGDKEGGKTLTLGDKQDKTQKVYDELLSVMPFYNIYKILSITGSPLRIYYQTGNPLLFYMPIYTNNNLDYITYYVPTNKRADQVNMIYETDEIEVITTDKIGTDNSCENIDIDVDEDNIFCQ